MGACVVRSRSDNFREEAVRVGFRKHGHQTRVDRKCLLLSSLAPALNKV
jgi:hypothetical protein